MNQFLALLGFDPAKHSVKVEMMAGLTTFLTMSYTWQEALAVVFVEGILFILLTMFKVREAIVHAIPLNLRYSITVGIGLFIAYVGLKNGGLIVASPDMLTMQGSWTASSLLAISGIILGTVLIAAKVKGALFYTIVIIAIVGIPFGVTPIPEDFMIISMPQSMTPVAFCLDFSAFLSFDINYYVVTFTL